MTIHITPEPEFSYVSFESNVAAANYCDLISRVIGTFQPGKFVITIFANKVKMAYNFLYYIITFVFFLFFYIQTSPASTASRELDYVSSFGEWQRRDIQYCRFKSYDLTYAHYCKFPSWGLQVMPLVEAKTYHSLPPSQSLSIPFQSKFLKISSFPFDIDFCAKQQTLFQTNSIILSQNNFIHFIILLNLLQLIPFVLVYYIEECSPLVLFSWWRNKISWNSLNYMIVY